MLRIGVVTLFPEMFDALTGQGVTARAIRGGLVALERVNPRDFTRDRHRTVDDRPYGGGPGMVMAAQPLADAVREARRRVGARARTVYLSPQGRRLDQAKVRELAAAGQLVLVCGRYEGVDERFVAAEIDEEISVGDYVLAGGEVPAMAVVEAVCRLQPGALGHEDSAAEDSFESGLLDCPHYTRPEEWEGRRVPAVLLGGDHGAVRRWRLMEALGRTWLRRPDLLALMRLDRERRELLEAFRARRRARAGDAGPGPDDGKSVGTGPGDEE